MGKVIDLTGRDFGKLKVTGFAGIRNHRAYWECLCECGQTCTVSGHDLTNEHTKSCGCLQHNRQYDNLIGETYGELTVIAPALRDKSGSACFLCRCNKCGQEKVVRGCDLLRGFVKSCGCLGKERRAEAHTTHGLSHDPTYKVWLDIKRRCKNSNRPTYKNYGGRGITIAPEWENDFDAFYDYVSKLEHFGEKGYSLDRIDNDKGYEPGNLRYATQTEQVRNRRNTVRVEYQGEMLTLKEAAEKSGINYGTLKSRYHAGDRGERLFRPVK